MSLPTMKPGQAYVQQTGVGRTTYLWTVDCPVCGLGKRSVSFDFAGFRPLPETTKLWATCQCDLSNDARVVYVTMAATAFADEYGGRK